MMVKDILDIIIVNEDNVRIYKLSATGKLYNFGKEPENKAEAFLIL